jgi:hypothetical protein
MRNLIVWLALPLVMLASCTTERPLSAASEKTVDVMVDNGIIKVPEDPAKGSRSQGVIKWQLDTNSIAAGFRFPDNGIEFDPNPKAVPLGCPKGDPDRAFHNCKPMKQGKEFHCNRRPGVFEPDACYKYSVRLTGPSGNPPDLDPWFRNRLN